MAEPFGGRFKLVVLFWLISLEPNLDFDETEGILFVVLVDPMV